MFVYLDSPCVVRLAAAEYYFELSFVYRCSLFLGATRKGAFTSKIVVELSTLCMSTFHRSVFQPIINISSLAILCIIWIVAAALTAEWSTFLYPFGCSGLSSELPSCLASPLIHCIHSRHNQLVPAIQRHRRPILRHMAYA